MRASTVALYYNISKSGQVTLKANYLQLDGYRLPTEAEWEYACRAEAVTSRYFGESAELLGQYAWFAKTSKDGNDRIAPVGEKKPNDFGLFDMHGNAWCWCQSVYRVYDAHDSDDIEDNVIGMDLTTKFVCRGGSFFMNAGNIRSAYRLWQHPDYRSSDQGFRLARTYLPAPLLR
jgi:eukaryotic-like serine/threonine-protein kinase